MKTDTLIQQDIEAALRWHSGIDATDIAVSVKDGVAALSGYARNYSEKSQAEEITKQVVGVNAIAADIQVRLPACDGRTDPEIARAATEALRTMLPGICMHLQLVVRDRHVILDGTVEWAHQRVQAESVIRRVSGVRALSNQIRVIDDLSPEGVKEQVERAFRERADLDASRVSVKTTGSEVKLTGKVASVAERTAALAAAAAAPGVSAVLDELVVE